MNNHLDGEHCTEVQAVNTVIIILSLIKYISFQQQCQFLCMIQPSLLLESKSIECFIRSFRCHLMHHNMKALPN